ncbi:MAG: zinc ABC transporter substrate-binding protein [Alphaproteobacteria bacterium]|nr:zinc ABC transporter substrate-binding protein [Alphaproteobacteria bacterium]
MGGDRGFAALRRRALLLGLAGGLGLLAGGPSALAQPRAQAQGARRPRVLATVAMIGDVAREIAGNRVEIATMMGEGVDPHLYRPTRSDIVRMLGSDIVFYNGLLLEGKLTDALVRAARAGRRVVPVTERLPAEILLKPAEPGGEGEQIWDPHVWMDPRLWSRVAAVIADTLAEADPPGREEYARGLADIQARIAALDAYAERALASIPDRQRVLITAHDAFHYFARRYGLRVEGIQGLSTESEAGVRRIEDLVALLVERRIPAVFVESSVPERNVRALVDGAAARGHRVAIGGTLFSDAMGAPGSYEGTYIGMIDHNVTAITRALGGQAPERGANARLAARATP